MQKRKLKDQSLISDYTYDYAIPDIVNDVLIDTPEGGQDGIITMVNQLTDKQCRRALLIYVREFNALQKKIEKAKDTLDRLL